MGMIYIDAQMPTNCYDCWIRQNMGCSIADDSGWPIDRRADNCPIQAQEPHVMTLEEYDAWTDLPFTERDPIFHEERTERGTVTCWVNTTVCSLREYGKNDRCWTSRPSDKQREATPW
jgi:hypothetical protein